VLCRFKIWPNVSTVLAACRALLRASQHLKEPRTENDDQKTGIDIARKALSWPVREIAIKCGRGQPLVVRKVLEKKQYGYGFVSQTGVARRPEWEGAALWMASHCRGDVMIAAQIVARKSFVQV
jgi:hypothetical protein